MNSPASVSVAQSGESQPRERSIPSFFQRAWRRLQYPGGPGRRVRLHAYRQRTHHGW